MCRARFSVARPVLSSLLNGMKVKDVCWTVLTTPLVPPWSVLSLSVTRGCFLIVRDGLDVSRFGLPSLTLSLFSQPSYFFVL